MAWAYLDDQFPDHPKVARAGGDAAWLYVCGLAYAKRYDTDGKIPKGQVAKLTDRVKPSALAATLVEVVLWEDRGDHYEIHDYEDWNKPAASRSEAGRKAARARWERNANADANAHAPPDANAYADACESQYEPPCEPDASECPPPQPLPSGLHLHPTSSGGRPQAGDDDASQGRLRRAKTACDLLGDRALVSAEASGRVKSNPDGYRQACRESARRDHLEAVQLLAHEHPDWSPEQLADALANGAPKDAVPGVDVAGIMERQTDEWRARRDAEPTPDPTVNREGIGAVRKRLRSLSAVPESESA